MRPAPRRGDAAPRRAPRKGLLLAAAAFLTLPLASCGARAMTPGSVPFPAERPVFVDDGGRLLRSLPDGDEPLTLVFLDFPWCPPCSDSWEAVARASGEVAPGSARVVRVLFNREMSLSREGISEVPPLRPPPPVPASLRFPTTTLTALPGPFREEYRVRRVPLLLLLDRRGRLLTRWTGDSPSLAEAIASEVRSRSAARPPSER